jgi:hypothetical protein
MTTSTSYWSPGEFYRSIKQHEQQFDTRAVYQAMHEYAPYRNPALLDVCPESYRLPMLSAISLYRHNPASFRDAILMAIGPPHSEGLWSRLATLARETLAVRDFRLLGCLAAAAETAWHAERIVPAEQSANALHEYARDKRACSLGDEPAEPAGGGRELLDAFARVFDLDERRLTAAEYLDSAVGYLTSLPASFVPPPMLVLQPTKKLSDHSWQILRRFWSSHYEQWQWHPHKLGELSSAANPLVVELGRQISALPPPKEEEVIELDSSTPLDSEGAGGAPRATSPFDNLAVEMPPPLVFARKAEATLPWHSRLWQWLLSWFRG